MTITTDGLSQLVREGDTLLTETLQAKKDIAAAITPVNTSAVNSAYDAAQAVTDDADIDMALSAVIQAEIAQVDTATGNVGSIQPAANKAPVTNRHNHVEAGFIDWSQIRYAKLQNPIMRVLAPNKLVDVLDGALTWTRASTATRLNPSTGLIEVMADNEPREEKQGWLIEGSATNHMRSSQDMSAGNWGYNTAPTIITDDVETAPDGTLTADLVVPSAASKLGGFGTFTGVAGDTITHSVFVKNAGRKIVKIGSVFGNLNALFDIDLLTELSRDTKVHSTSIKLLSNGWVHLSVTGEFTNRINNLGLYPLVAIKDDNGDQIGNDIDGMYVWGYQTEAGGLSSYIATINANVTRAADVVQVNDVTNNYVPNDGAMSISLNYLLKDASNNACMLDIGGNTDAQSIMLIAQPQLSRLFAYYAGETQTIAIMPKVMVADKKYNVTTTYLGTDIDGYIDGEHLVTTDKAGQVPTPVNPKIYIGRQWWNGHYLNGHLSDIRIYDFALNKHEVAFLSQGAS